MIKIRGTKDSTTALMAYPAFGYPSGAFWRIHVSGVISQNPAVFSMRQRMMIRMLGGVMQATPDQMQGAMFQERIKPFMAEGDHRQPILVTFNGKQYSLKKKTRRNGHFDDSFVIDRDEVDSVSTVVGGTAQIKLLISTEDQNNQPVECVAKLYPTRGISVVSDIDDTIKDSMVIDRRELLVNTFLREFRSVDGMSDVYRQWEANGAGFHYVSSSPWQLFQSLQQMHSIHDFPNGTMHLRNFRLRDQLLKRIILRRKGKASEIKRLMEYMPDRDFILVGDSGEKDPKIYLKMCRRFGNRVKGVFIREIAERPLETDLFRKLQASTSAGNCKKFSTAKELANLSSEIFAQ